MTNAQPGIEPRAIEVPTVPVGIAQEVALDGLSRVIAFALVLCVAIAVGVAKHGLHLF